MKKNSSQQTHINNLYFEGQRNYSLTKLYTDFLKKKFDEQYDSEIHLTSVMRKQTKRQSQFDAIINVKERNTKRVMYKLVIKAKVRNVDYNSLMIEKHKVDEMFKSFNATKEYDSSYTTSSLIYINFTPSGVYLFNLSHPKLIKWLADDSNWFVKELDKTTADVDAPKVKKEIYLLPKYLATHYNYFIPSNFRVEITDSKPKEIIKSVQPVKDKPKNKLF